MPRYLINDKEAAALKKLVNNDKLGAALGFDEKVSRAAGNFPFRFKLLEAFGATTANKANAAIYFFGDTTDNKIDTDFVVNDSSQFSNYTSGNKGVCLASSEYHVLEFFQTLATEYMSLATTDYAATDTSIVVDNLEPMNGLGTTLTQLTVNNTFGWPVINNGDCYIKFNSYTSLYELIQTRCT